MKLKTEELASQVNVTSKKYLEDSKLFIENLKTLPPTELHYYFALLVSSITNEKNPEQHRQLIIKANTIVDELKKFYNDGDKPDVTKVMEALNQLIISSNVQSIPYKVKMAVLWVCSVMLGFIGGLVGAVSGLVGGLLSDYTVVGNLRASGLGFITGLALGIFAGSRCPSMLFQSAFERKLAFCINGIDKVVKELPSKKPYKDYEKETKEYIFQEFFKDMPEEQKEAAFKAFLEDENQAYKVSTTTAGFFFRELKGHVGHHSLIAFKINEKKHIPMEYGERKKTPNFFNQYEERPAITGKKLFEMMVLDCILQETYEYNVKGFLDDYEIGSNDCRTYVDKILLGTNQHPTVLPRFAKNDKWAGTHIVGPIVRFFSKTNEAELSPIGPFYKAKPEDPDPTIIVQEWPKLISPLAPQ